MGSPGLFELSFLGSSGRVVERRVVAVAGGSPPLGTGGLVDDEDGFPSGLGVEGVPLASAEGPGGCMVDLPSGVVEAGSLPAGDDVPLGSADEFEGAPATVPLVPFES